MQFRRVGNELTGRKVAFISVDLSRNWSKDEMRAIVLHELGHALGIRGHSVSKGDIMYWQVQEKSHQVRVPGIYYPYCLEIARQQAQPAGSQYPDSAL